MNGSFVGVVIAKQSFAFSNPHAMTIQGIADHHPESKLVSAEIIYSCMYIEDDNQVSWFSFEIPLISSILEWAYEQNP